MLTLLIHPVHHLMMPRIGNGVTQGHGLLKVQGQQRYSTCMRGMDRNVNTYMQNRN